MSTKNSPSKPGTAGGEQPRDEKPGVKPVHELRLGRIRAAIWLNETENGPRYNVQLTRLYKDKNDQWKDSTSFGREDLPLVMKVADLAHTWIYENPAGSEK